VEFGLSTIITRKALIHWGGQAPASNVTYIVAEDHGPRTVVTWEDVHAARRERQRLILQRKRESKAWRAVRLSVAYFDQDLMGGWQAFLDGIDPWDHVWIDRDGKPFIERIMEVVPLPMLFKDNWHDWKIAFAQHYQRRRQDGKPVGVAFLWKRGYELRA
jgi:hypothetical protein